MNPEDIDLSFEEILTECTALLERMDVMLGTIEPMTGTEARRLLKCRKGGELIVRELARQCSELEIASAGCVSVEQMTRAMESADAAQRVLERLDLVRARLAAARFRASSASWKSAMTFYALLRSLATHGEPHAELRDPALDAAAGRSVAKLPRDDARRLRELPRRAPGLVARGLDSSPTRPRFSGRHVVR